MNDVIIDVIVEMYTKHMTMINDNDYSNPYKRVMLIKNK